jgi:hypothetical protein
MAHPVIRRMAGGSVRRVVGGFALVLALALGSPDARATTLAPLTVEQVTDASTYIVEGRVEEIWTEIDTNDGKIWTRARVTVSEVLKGPDRPTTLVVDTPGGRYGDIEMYVPSSAVFSAGEDVFLFLHRGSTRITPVGMFQGKYTIRRAPGETRQHAMTWMSSRSTPFDARFLPHPAPADRVYLDDLREQVEHRLDVGWDGQPIPGLSAERLQQLNTLEARSPGAASTSTNGSQP